MSRFGRIVVGLDASEGARRALRFAVDLAFELDAEIVGVHGRGLLEEAMAPGEQADLVGQRSLPPGSEGDESFEQQMEAWLSEIVSEHGAGEGAGRSAGLPRHRWRVVEGNPVMALVAAGRAEDASMIVVGSRGAGGFAGLVLGSTSQQLALHADRPVVIVPGP